MSDERVAGALSELAAGARFRPFHPGVELAELAAHPTLGPEVALLRYAPGASTPEHVHRGFELILVLSGSQRDERGSYPAGSLVINREGERHRVWSDEGCVVLIAWQRPVEIA